MTDAKNNPSQKLLNMGLETGDNVKELKNTVNTLLVLVQELTVNLNKVQTDVATIASAPSKSRSASGSKSVSAATTNGIEKKFPANKLAWLKIEYMQNPDLLKKHFTPAQLRELDDHMAEDDKADLVGMEKSRAEFSYVWGAFVQGKGNEKTTALVTEMYQTAKAEHENMSKTAAQKEEVSAE